MIEQIPFGATGHKSTRILFGAAALGAMRQDKADAVLSMILDRGINHIDVAASYGDAELRLAPFLQDHRGRVFLATKTGKRTRDAALRSIENSLERMQVDQIDMIQMHNLTNDSEWETALGDEGSVKAAIEAKEQGMVRFIGVTGHGTRAAEMHLKSLEAYEFDSVLLPYSYMMMQDTQYAAEFDRLYEITREKQVAMQTIKSIARRRWREDDPSKRFSWYEPIREEAALRRAVHYVLDRPGIFLNSSSDASLLQIILDAASEFDENNMEDLESAVKQDAIKLNQEALFIRGEMDEVR